ncbi:hypothetical protein H0H92_002087, partial [Tricholoma furcatifolium]
MSHTSANESGRTPNISAAMGSYQEGVAKNEVNKLPVTAHILYEYTTQISIFPPQELRAREPLHGSPDLGALLLQREQLKEDQLSPLVIQCLWSPSAIERLRLIGRRHAARPDVDITPLKGIHHQLQRPQNFEYKMSNILDKPPKSIFGYTSILHGAFSAYRYIALRNVPVTGEGPLPKYFLSKKMHRAGADIFTANMYLAEDRILCWDLVAKRGANWVLQCVESAYVVTDVPDQVPSQRRRWLNGSFVAVHGTVHLYILYPSTHTFFRKFWIDVEANYYIAFLILTTAMEDPTLHVAGIKIIIVNVNYFYVGPLMCFILSLGNGLQGSKWGWGYTMAFIG